MILMWDSKRNVISVHSNLLANDIKKIIPIFYKGWNRIKIRSNLLPEVFNHQINYFLILSKIYEIDQYIIYQ